MKLDILLHLIEGTDLNTKITDFLDTRAEKLTREQWLEKYTKATEPPLT